MSWNGKEKRIFPRANFPCKITVGSKDIYFNSHTENIGEGGVKVILEEKLKRAMPVNLELILGEDKKIICKGEVVWVEERVNPLSGKASLFDTGIQFLDMSENDRNYIKKLVDTLIAQNKV
ncbi:MAG: PilZ domain-containing protein [Candidatus Omnitrophica bacterium]|nr:PilZ domain-containing protein [Candidatus Omnitrophota bacterium]